MAKNLCCWVYTSTPRPRDFSVACGLAMPIDSHYGLIDFRDIALVRMATGGISVPISRGSPPIFNRR
ncbi:MAG TPA: hypothetical protein VKR06_00825 [Ktedonosporobacter sp.]|nr:hypothetical protein [Ktedonosporobacter sp.]